MDLGDALRRRRMVRRYRSDPVDPAVVDRIVAAGSSGPTAGGTDGISITVIADAVTRTAVAAVADESSWVAKGYEPWLSRAPVHLVLSCHPALYRDRYTQPDKDPNVIEAIPWWWVDAGASLMAMLLAATGEGLAAGFLGAHRLDGIKSIVGLGDDAVVVGVITIGTEA